MNPVISVHANELIDTLEQTLRLRNQLKTLSRTAHAPAVREYIEQSYRLQMSKLNQLTGRNFSR